MSPLLKLENFKLRYGAVEAVRGINLEIGTGEIVALLGANGAGKSSTMNGIAGLAPVAEGRVVFDGRDITALPPEEIPISGLTLAPEGRRVFGTLTVDDNLRMGAYSVSDPGSVEAARQRVLELFPILSERHGQYAGTLSGGQQQMLAIGRALMCQPRLLLLDEPSLGLAPLVIEQIYAALDQLRARGKAFLVVEENPSRLMHFADRLCLMDAGHVVWQGSAAEARESGDILKTYLGGH